MMNLVSSSALLSKHASVREEKDTWFFYCFVRGRAWVQACRQKAFIRCRGDESFWLQLVQLLLGGSPAS